MTKMIITIAKYKEIKKAQLQFGSRYPLHHMGVSQSTLWRITRSKSYAEYRRLTNPKLALKAKQPSPRLYIAQGRSELAAPPVSSPAITHEHLMRELVKSHNEIRHLTALLENAHVYHASEVPKSSRRFFGLLK
jgi:DNA-binding MurR/RpiR family transcriptional regulator